MIFRRMYDWVLSWSDTRYGVPILAAVAFVESSFFPVPPDPLLMALSLGKPKKAFWFAFVCSVASVLGGVAGYLIGMALWDMLDEFFLTYVFSQDAFNFVSVKYEENAVLAIFGAALTPIPFKVFTVTAGVFKINIFIFVIASAIGRSARFFMEAGLIHFYGKRIKSFIDNYFNILLFVFFFLVIIGFILVKYVLKH